MNEKSKLLPAIIIVGVFALLFGAGGFFIAKKVYQTEWEGGSVNITHEYQATTTALMTGTLIKAAQTDQFIASSTAGITLGSVVIASTTVNWMTIYNATSSAAVADGTYATKITTFLSSASLGTYTYDVWLDKGLVIRMETGFAGDYTITYRR